jgi:GTP-binding protein
VSAQLPIVAIVGRPNVGKSTLFNRYAGRRRVLVEDQPGVTRDRIAEEIEVEGRRVLLVDTAGLDPDADSEIESAVQEQVREAIEGADAILFVVDGQAGLLPQEEELATELRRSQQPVLVAVNKIDAPGHSSRVFEFHALGLDPVRGVSGEHATGAWDALEELVAALPPATEEAEPEPQRGLRVALVGRPNVGKSSLLNRLAGENRVVVSNEPGTTRDSIDVALELDGQRYVFVDTAGLRRSAKRDRHVERGSALMTLRAIERAEVALVLIDAEEGITDQDVRVLSLVRERGCACAMVVNKWDLIEKAEDEDDARRLEDMIERRLRPMSDTPVVRISAKTGRGMKRVLPLARKISEAAAIKISTSELNRWLKECTELHEPAMASKGVHRRPIKFFYATQTEARPPTFLLFCTDPQSIQMHYRRFLENRLRETFDLAGVPVRLRLRKRSQDRHS